MSDTEKSVPFFVHEAEMERHMVQHRRAFVEKLVLIILLVATNAMWIWYESQFEYFETSTTIEAQQDGDGVNIVSGGGVDYGATGEDQHENAK